MTSFALGELRAARSKPDQQQVEQAAVRVIPLFVRKTWRYRSYTATARGIEGSCMAPWLQAGDAVFVDPTVEPRDGDLVCVLLTYVVERERVCPGARQEIVPAKVARRESIKVLRIIDGERWLVTVNDGAVRLDDMQDAEIVGTVTASHRWRWWRRGRRCGNCDDCSSRSCVRGAHERTRCT